ncbi:tripartite tricarboxylate transporter substrate binding protein [Variovorax sp. WS11]|uniref:Bug family tripartite tricarboxylate transporter substrate binding protein n=1 Tax=Variovorax sp. WS11 TaxID=1105204 RepID=UPI0013DC80AC|nr:tripartite tricarboxylate transporter substrate binding protein [Variovorax sp. WS11]NDZ17004.1 tripartite tricarboxylate transporter substrate binding protein [Variovorax sp. WS11]
MGLLRSITRTTLIALIATVLTFSDATAQADFPSKPITVLVAAPPGGPSDVTTRIVAQRLATRLGRSVVVENRPGASGFIVMQQLARSAADGHTLALSSLVYHILNPALYKEKLPYDPERDFVPVALLARVPYILVAAPGLPANDVKEFIALAKKNPGKFNYGLPGGSGNTSHILMEMLKKAADIDIVPVPYQGDAPALMAVMSNQVEVAFTTPLGATSLIKAGKLKLLGTATAERLSTFPNTKTFAQQGLPALESSTWFSFIAPAGTPRAVLERLNAEIDQILQLPEVEKQLQDLGSVPAGGSLEATQAFMRAERPRWTRRVEDSGAKIE